MPLKQSRHRYYGVQGCAQLMSHRGQEHGADLVRQLLELFDLRDIIKEDDNFPAIVNEGRPKLDVMSALLS